MQVFLGEQFGGDLVAEASSLGMKPGLTVIQFRMVWSGGETEDFRLTHTARQDGDVLGWDYVSEAGKEATILND